MSVPDIYRTVGIIPGFLGASRQKNARLIAMAAADLRVTGYPFQEDLAIHRDKNHH
jgi:hypothetical protein